MNNRSSNIELLRIVAMLLVIFLHANYLSLGVIKVDDINNEPVISFVRILFQQLCIVSVNIFVLIAGWFGIKPSLKGAMSLLYQVFFFSLLITATMIFMGVETSLKSVLLPFYFGVSWWFVPAYLILYAVSPILNTFCEKTSPKVQFFTLVAFFSVQFIYDFIGSYAHFIKGYSAISFIGLYILARFVKLHSEKLKSISRKTNILLYLLFTIIPVLLTYINCPRIIWLAYNNPFVIAASLFILLAFVKIQFDNKFINYIACSAFSIYLVHMHPLVIPYFIRTMKTAYETLGGDIYILFVVGLAIVFGLLCVMLDKLRIASWNFLYKTIISKIITQIEVLFLKIYEWIIN